MMVKALLFSLLVASPLVAIPAVAAPNDGMAQTAAVNTLESVARLSPSDGGAYVELAQAYVRANRLDDAATAYRRTLVLDNVMLVTRNGDSIWSHQVARAALAKLPQLQQISSR